MVELLLAAWYEPPAPALGGWLKQRTRWLKYANQAVWNVWHHDTTILNQKGTGVEFVRPISRK